MPEDLKKVRALLKWLFGERASQAVQRQEQWQKGLSGQNRVTGRVVGNEARPGSGQLGSEERVGQVLVCSWMGLGFYWD